jgi:serine/threonine-protein kinase
MNQELSANTNLSHYSIVAKLGAGGMGEVYRARDMRLDREVAIKVLPASFAQDADRLRRFEQEARATSALNHPNILTIYDIGTHEGAPFIVAELLEGEELRAQMKDRALPVRKVVEYARQITAGLAAAHEKGIVHRDLKPENLFVTKDGRVKILDFGLAKLKTPRNAPAGSEFVTQKQLTSPGMVMGTVAYMSPEQVRGEEVDHRSDLFSLGLILFEMLRGEQAFQRETMAETMTAILKDEAPELSETNAKISPQLEKIVRHCLEKKPELRFQSARDLAFALEALSGSSGSSEAQGGLSSAASIAPARLQSRERRLWGAAVLALSAVVAGMVLWLLAVRPASTPTTPHVRRMTIKLADDVPASARFGLAPSMTSIALSPDGMLLVYAFEHNGESQLYRRALDQFEATPIPGAEGAYSPFFSPDGQQVGFFSGNKLKKVSLQGGETVTLCEVRNPHGASWGADDTIVFAESYGTILSRIPASGGKPQVVLKPGDTPGSPPLGLLFYPEFLPGAKSVLFCLSQPVIHNDSFRIGVFSLETGKWHLLREGGTNPRYAASGHIVFNRAGRLLAVPFDLSRLEVTGPAVTLIEGIRAEGWVGAQFALSPDGTLVYASGSPTYISKLTWVDRRGVSNPLDAPGQSYGQAHLSPDGQRLAVAVRGITTDIWVYEFARETFSRLTVDDDHDTPQWTPDGKRIAYFRNKGPGQYETVWKLADGSGDEEVLTSSKNATLTVESFSPDGKLLAFTESNPEGSDIWVLPLEGERKPQPWLKTKYTEWGAAFSRDGKYIAYVSDESGQDELYVRPYAGSGRKWQISTGGGEKAVWSRDGRELFYHQGQKWMSVAVRMQPEFHAEAPRLMFEVPYLNIADVSYDVAPDGQRFIMLEESFKQPPITHLNVVLNWFEELKQRTPGGD